MKNRAYTLAEVLVALGIIGILAAVSMPLVNKFKPDTTKVLYLNTYDALSDAIVQMANNDSYYPPMDDNFNYEQHPFANLAEVRSGDAFTITHVIPGGINKFCNILAESLETIESANEVVCNNNVNTTAFTAKNGVAFRLHTTAAIANNSNYFTDITVDVNGFGNGNDCNITTCANNREPDQFLFRVYADTELLPNDEQGIRYIETRTNLRYKKATDYNNAGLRNDIQDRLNQARTKDTHFVLPAAPQSQQPEEE